MDKIIVEFQEGEIGKQDALTKLRDYLDSNDFGSEVLINAVALLIRNYSFEDENVRRVLGLLLELGLLRDLEVKIQEISVLGCSVKDKFKGVIIKTLVKDVLLEGLNVKDLEIRLKSLSCLNIVLKLLSLQKDHVRSVSEYELDTNGICNLLLQIVFKEKSIMAKKIAISSLGLVSGGKIHLLDLLKSDNYVLRMKSLESIQILDLDNKEMMILFSRMLDENYRVRRVFYRYLFKNAVNFRNLVFERMLWPHFMLVCQFGLNDRNSRVKTSCSRFLIEFISENYGGGCFDGNSFISFLDDMINSIYFENGGDGTDEKHDCDLEEYGGLTASNVEAITEILLPCLISHSRCNLDTFVKQVTTHDVYNDISSNNRDHDSEIMLNLKTSQILALRVLVENYKDQILESGKYDFVNIENVIISISRNSNNSFIIRQMLLILTCLDKSDPEVMKVVEALSINCLKYTPIDDSLELHESELMPPESMVRSQKGGEWVAYFLHRSVIRASIESLKSCMEGNEQTFVSIIKEAVDDVLNPKQEVLLNETDAFDDDIGKLGISELTDLLEKDFNNEKENRDLNNHSYIDIRESIEMRWMRVLFIIESFLSLTGEISQVEADHITEVILKPCMTFFFKYSEDHQVPQILLARCTALATIFKEKFVSNSDLDSIVVDSENDNFCIFVKGLENALLDLNNKGGSSNTIYVSVLCEVYVSAIVDILVIRQMRNGGNINFCNDIIEGIGSIWRLANCCFFSTHRLSSIAMRGISRIFLCLNLKTKDNQSLSVEILTCLLFLVYFSGTLDEFEVLIEPQGGIFVSKVKNPDIGDHLIDNKDNNLRISSGDKQILLYLFSTYITLGFEHIKCFTVAIYKLLETLCVKIGVTRWNSGISKSVNKLLLFGIIQVKQALSSIYLKRKNDRFYSNVYGILFLYYIFNKYPTHFKKIGFRTIANKLFSDIHLEKIVTDNKGANMCEDVIILRDSFIHILREIECTNEMDFGDRTAFEIPQKKFKENLKFIRDDCFSTGGERDDYLRKIMTTLKWGF
ncbi:hypothetical protein RS030_5704 [Cryptosporidium xiaoi]|uniref:Uncharacterized protein n=1 Tax=Cryptosporidium xiaoi TaxID=659607 RepID=A0AAV9Y128_9CRYT